MIDFGLANETARIAEIWETASILALGRACCNETVYVIGMTNACEMV